jgi:hypothetical protein
MQTLLNDSNKFNGAGGGHRRRTGSFHGKK